MALRITRSCIGCNACKLVCPQKAVVRDAHGYAINAHRCDECVSQPNPPQCGEICPIECAIVDNEGRALNPLGSLTGIPCEQEQVIQLTELAGHV
ncbi:4Fe-4S binding protein [Aliagarivorans taiwanensis]|uniref:4Fe-4S binding protein n=1 Tax=Aliagarivorans taiwanensis TaxID=561966 RepID=UPI0004130127|nr:4Fe-4S binding protein [Aliagarivorans taiwanensis]